MKLCFWSPDQLMKTNLVTNVFFCLLVFFIFFCLFFFGMWIVEKMMILSSLGFHNFQTLAQLLVMWSLTIFFIPFFIEYLFAFHFIQFKQWCNMTTGFEILVCVYDYECNKFMNCFELRYIYVERSKLMVKPKVQWKMTKNDFHLFVGFSRMTPRVEWCMLIVECCYFQCIS